MKSTVFTRSVFNPTNAAIGVISLLTLTFTACVFAASMSDQAERATTDWFVVCTIFSAAIGPALGFTYMRPVIQLSCLCLSMAMSILSLAKISTILL